MIKVQKEDFSLESEMRDLCQHQSELGAIVNFIGVVREGTGDKKISSMTLEHYPGMTERQLKRIEDEARARWQLIDCLIIHRYGKLFPGDNIVLVLAASPHRAQAFQAAQFMMDFLKSRAPFWKNEETAQGSDWVEARQSDEDL